MAKTFNSVYDSMLNAASAVDYTGQVEGMLNNLMSVNAQDLGAPVDAELKKYSAMKDDYNSKIKYYDDLLANNSSKKQFIKTIEDNGYTTSRALRDGIDEYHQEFLSHVQKAKQATIDSFETNRNLFDGMFKDMTRMSPNKAQRVINSVKHTQSSNVNIIDDFQKGISGFSSDYAQQLEDISREITSRTDGAASILKNSRKQAEVNEAFKSHNKWIKNMEKGANGASTQEVVTAYKGLEQRRDSTLQSLRDSGQATEELEAQVNRIFDEATQGYKNVLGEGGQLNASATETYMNRTNALTRITEDIGPDGKRRRKNNNTGIDYTLKDLRRENPDLYDDIIHPRIEYNPETKEKKVLRYTDEEVNQILSEGKSKTKANRVRTIENPLNAEADPLSIKRSLNPFREVEQAPMRSAEKAGQEAVERAAKEGAEDLAEMSTAKKLLKRHGLNSLFNGVLTVADYKESRREGDSILKAGAKAGANFVIGETLGMAAIPFYMASSLPSLAVKGVEGLSSMNREMNSAARMQPFAEASFQDTQQLATMRQAGMEMAKMSQYNLQQTIMGNEAQYLR